MNFSTLQEVLELRLVEYFQQQFQEIDPELLFTIFRDINLQVIDRLWVNHIDEMQQLKDKVGFMGYAQLDPLIEYKKESFEKFQTLLDGIRYDTATMLMRLDFQTISQQQQVQLQVMAAVEKDPELLARLKSASNLQQSSPTTKSPSDKSRSGLPPFPAAYAGRGTKGGNQRGKDAREVLFSDEDGVEIIELNEGEQKSEVMIPERRKVRPNDPCPCGSGKKYKKCCGVR